MEYTRPRAKLVTLLGVLELPRWEDVWLAEVCLRIPTNCPNRMGNFPKPCCLIPEQNLVPWHILTKGS
ncbi:hypothetical protein LWI28_000723 [Acer negundo]|uniref:Uncharacterized protein n=1 Tax=Acer negundo TaxID=4023 RepID=A0AAD5IY42_ACENE|nr:hypothetical protein LWI28_000723 [Acer negundo]